MIQASSTFQIITALAGLLFFNCYNAFSQSVLKINSNEDDKAHLILAVSKLNQAMVDRDQATLKLLTMDELSYGHSSGKIENKEAFIHEVVNGDFVFISTATENQTILFSGEDTAVVRHIFSIDAINKGENVSIRIGNMLVFKKQQNQWKLLARQGYKL